MDTKQKIEDYIYKYELPIEVAMRGGKFRAFSVLKKRTPVTSWLTGHEMLIWLKGYDIGFVDGWEDKARE